MDSLTERNLKMMAMRILYRAHEGRWARLWARTEPFEIIEENVKNSGRALLLPPLRGKEGTLPTYNQIAPIMELKNTTCDRVSLYTPLWRGCCRSLLTASSSGKRSAFNRRTNQPDTRVRRW